MPFVAHEAFGQHPGQALRVHRHRHAGEVRGVGHGRRKGGLQLARLVAGQRLHGDAAIAAQVEAIGGTGERRLALVGE